MFNASDLIEALRRRQRRSIRPDTPAEGFPPGWAQWFASMRARPGAVIGASAEAIVAELAARPEPPRRRGRVPPHALAAWLSLVHPLWEPGPREDRGARRFSLAVALFAQLLWVGGLLLLTHARFAVPAPSAAGEEHVVQAVFIGNGTPEEPEGGDAPPAPAPTAQVAPAADPAPVAPARPAPAPNAPRDTSVAPEAVVDAAPVEPAPQTLQVTEVPAPDIDFTLPPPRTDALPEVVVRERAVPEVELQTLEVPALRSPAPLAEVPAQRQQVEVEVRERAVPQPAETLRLPTRDAPQIAVETPQAPSRQAPEVVARERSVPLREGAPTTSAPARPAAPNPAPSAAPSESTSPTAASRPAPAPAPGTSPQRGLPPGAAPSPRTADDWGDATSARDGGTPGNVSGLFGADGRPRLADGGRVGGGLPPGTITEDFARIDREGTWLKRPPTDYEPTSFDRFWTPSETLLEEWVRRSIKTVLIPIPGTSKTVQCNVALLMFGGACGITDPNMQDVETDGRPPPDVPWKPELQEAQDSLRR